MNINILPPTTKRVQLNTKPEINKAIKEQAVYNLNAYRNADEATLSKRTKELNKEWDTERFLEANAATIILICSILGLKHSKAFLLTGTISFFLLQHALQGWCPPLSIIRKIGIRTADEINIEKTAIKMMRGDFSHKPDTAYEMLEMAEK